MLCAPTVRVWRYRGGRDGHETLQQFMNFLGREPAARAEGERETGTLEPSRSQKPYAGVAVFCLHHLAGESEEDVVYLVNSLQVKHLVSSFTIISSSCIEYDVTCVTIGTALGKVDGWVCSR